MIAYALCMIRGSKYPELDDRDWLEREYVTNGRTATKIARQLGTSPNQVSRRLHQHGIPVRGRYPGKWKPRNCETCQETYLPTGPAQRFCSLACRPDAQTCTQCGNLFRAGSPRKFCSFECLTAWRGENCSHRYVNSDGYVIVKVQATQHRDVNNNGYARVNLGTGRHGNGRVLEHRHVMEQIIGRPLLPTEEVHHKNTVKTDNSPGNLELWDTGQPKGGRVEDKIKWALDFLSAYGEVAFTPTITYTWT